MIWPFRRGENHTILSLKKILGQAGVDFPVLASVPDTGFDCGGQEFPGIYGDTGADCQVIFVEIIPKKMSLVIYFLLKIN